MWLWQDLEHFAFDFAEQVRLSEDFRNEIQFGRVASALADEAERHIEGLRIKFGDLSQVAERLIERPARRGYVWESFHAGVAAALVGRPEEAEVHLRRVLDEDPFAPWIAEVQQVARHVHEVAHDSVAVRGWAAAAIASCRRKLTLDEPAAPPVVLFP
ncbi:hypothetical protein [Streptomyces sp. NPDC002994]|uniref:hypothetical protein n=1 Tax=Streptomyces sp. NPDC002994 TaxID=3154441 RepID=UPI0033BD09A2